LEKSLPIATGLDNEKLLRMGDDDEMHASILSYEYDFAIGSSTFLLHSARYFFAGVLLFKLEYISCYYSLKDHILIPPSR